MHVGHVGKAALRQGQGQRVLRKGNSSRHAAAYSVASKRVRMASSKAAYLAKWSSGVSLVNQKWRMSDGFISLLPPRIF